jgi:hypothetical protein
MGIESKALNRALRAVKCAPFGMKLLEQMLAQSIPLRDLTDDRGIYNGYTLMPLGERSAEGEMLWLISVGIFRREVDGQGLTDSFRLTPLGREVLTHWQTQGCPDWRGSLMDNLQNSLNRWVRLPSWLA